MVYGQYAVHTSKRNAHVLCKERLLLCFMPKINLFLFILIIKSVWRIEEKWWVWMQGVQIFIFFLRIKKYLHYSMSCWKLKSNTILTDFLEIYYQIIGKKIIQKHLKFLKKLNFHFYNFNLFNFNVFKF